MKTAMTLSIPSKCHTITSASYSIKYPTYQILFRVQLTIRYPSAWCILTCIFKVFFCVQFTLHWPSWSTYSRVVDDGFPVSTKQWCVDSEKSHVRPNTIDGFSPQYFISHLVIYTIYPVTCRLREAHNKGASTMKTAMTWSFLSKCHTITSASYSIKYPTYQILFRVQLTIR